MGAVQLLAYGSFSQNDNQTRFYQVSGALTVAASITTEVQGEVPIRTAGTLDRLFVRVTSNTATVTSTVTLRVNQADTALTLSIGADLTGEFEDTSNSVSVGATDEVDLELTIPAEAGTNTMTLSLLGMVLTPSSGTVSPQMAAATGDNMNTASSTRYYPVGYRAGGGVEANMEWAVQDDFIASRLYAYVSSNGRSTDTIWRTRKNGSDGAQAVTFASGETGAKEDTTNSDTLTAGDEFNLALVTSTGAGTITTSCGGVQIASDSNQFPLLGSTADDPVTVNLTNYVNFGRLGVVSTTESSTQLLSRLTYTASKLTAYISANTATAASTIKVRVDGADGTQVLSFAAGETGTKTDSSNTDVLTAGTNRYCVQLAPSGGALTLRSLTMTGETAAAAVGQPTIRRFGLAEYVARPATQRGHMGVNIMHDQRAA